jgi:signal transduction histidine kinase
MKNITDLKKLKDQLYHSDKLSSIGMLVSGVAHEINNPLTGILGYTELLQMKNPEGPLKTELEKIYTSAERCKTIVENLLTFSRQRPPHRSLENINDIIDRTVELRIYWLRSNNVIIETKYAEIPYTMLDPQQIQQVILNMLINAEYAVTQVADRRQGSIGIWTGFSPESNEITITMTDNGTGIDEGHLNKIFDPFFSTKPVDKGTGLGLSISHGIIKEHGGEIEVHSRKDEYTTFIIRMPVDKKVTE